ncbi:MAG: Tyrosine-tRNA ligase [Candidatus Pacebacteria bacterium GW2011_GWF2_38_9]|nr:MAG: tyrosyl-tRNA synthetase, tyrosyl-tRNA synthetase [candidate division TM6 bacterium GW2011_GWF2_28_16]KKQ10106.1 MAG: Tyrosine-tRNA ligase [Candidatus Pacebacteria bacterium GW2011_GWF1_36_5]KKQ89062.1 MAG: Tyrosine-tRNA ligase [Candidatus Pacebacteria bacterium GW2011_GWF2_38_9]HAZ73563.1 tyrosine--tRNA ligase [Candidatus Paceibacterota bacterium]
MPDTNPQKIQTVLTRGVSEILPNKDGLSKIMTEKKIRLYLGIDPTGAFLHLGHAVGLRKLQQFAELGHQVILLVGNGTVKIGDPTGRDESRPMLDDATIEENFQEWKKQASKILDFDLIEIRHNGDWLDKLNYADMVKLMAKTTVQQLIERDMFQKRLNDGFPIFGHEIIYPLLQGYDSVVMDVDLEIGGTDQTFNMMMGRHLQQQYNGHEKWVLTTPLIEGTDGRKMSKSFNNYVALTDEPREMYGKLMSIKDELIIKYFEVLTDVDSVKISEMATAMQNGSNPMEFKKKLALIITKDLHDEVVANDAANFFAKTVQNDEMPEESNFGSITIKNIKKANGENAKSIEAKPELSSTELGRRIEQGAVKILPSMQKIESREEFLNLPKGTKLKLGKRDWYKIETTD